MTLVSLVQGKRPLMLDLRGLAKFGSLGLGDE